MGALRSTFRFLRQIKLNLSIGMQGSAGTGGAIRWTQPIYLAAFLSSTLSVVRRRFVSTLCFALSK
jgi:hypothetical protein